MHGCVGEAWPRVLPPWVTKDVKGIPKNQWCLSYQMWNHHGQRILEVCRPVSQWSNLSIFWLCCSRHVQLCLHDISWLGQIEWDKIWDLTSPCEWMHECSLIRRLMPTSGYPIMCTWHLPVVHRMNPHMAFIFHAFPMGGCRNGLTSRGTCPTTLPSLTKRAYAGQRVQHSARMAFTGRRHKLNWCFLVFED